MARRREVKEENTALCWREEAASNRRKTDWADDESNWRGRRARPRTDRLIASIGPIPCREPRRSWGRRRRCHIRLKKSADPRVARAVAADRDENVAVVVVAVVERPSRDDANRRRWRRRRRQRQRRRRLADERRDCSVDRRGKKPGTRRKGNKKKFERRQTMMKTFTVTRSPLAQGMCLLRIKSSLFHAIISVVVTDRIFFFFRSVGADNVSSEALQTLLKREKATVSTVSTP